MSFQLLVNTAGLMVGADAPELPGLGDFYPEPILFAGTAFALDRIMLIRLLSLFTVTVLFAVGASRAKLVPGRFQSALELVLDFARVQIVESVIESPKMARRYTPEITVIFLGVFALNITGVLPFMNIAGSSVVGAPIVFAIFAYVLFIGAGIAQQGFFKFFKSQLFPSGVPWPIYFLVTPIEAFSTFVVRPATLIIRLLANMISGHILLALTFFGTHYLFFYAQGYIQAVGALTLLASLFVIALELLVAVVQAYVFAMLTSVYIQLSVSEH
ncbi:F0F1 ATP synthase subunit A [Boudabousia marimammalium]|uniref:ATP synthase subunit a n=1 Tax=Boudabousia marimammalium TaxID=156892 RepID=A0A1Q5PRJ3_9ACTO|nr:F0F1 ATP synthase subunit A [Boudabousia marimammalium]OKL50166.1 ATP synthase F0 subunit A [Boudabousia marimammalium]